MAAVLLLAFALAAGTAAGGENSAALYERADRLLLAVRAALLEAHPMNYRSVEIEISSHTVILRGPVPHLAAKEKATLVVRSVQGVRNVQDELELENVARSSEKLCQDFQRLARRFTNEGACRLQAGLLDGVVTLEGEMVANSRIKSEFVNGIKAIPGVRRIEDSVVCDRTPEPDLEVRESTETLLKEGEVGRLEYQVTTEEGYVEVSIDTVAPYEQVVFDCDPCPRRR